MASNSHSLWSSARLVYQAIDSEDEAFLLAIRADSASFVNADTALPLPSTKKNVTDELEYLRDHCLLAVKICLQPVASSPLDQVAPKAVPIGRITLSASTARNIHHRHSMIGINILRPYQGQGYGSEAIRWVLRWGFMYANLHRIDICAFAYNEGAWKLYERLGFVHEGVKREQWFSMGRYWDSVELAMLEHEWRKLYGDEAGKISVDGGQIVDALTAQT